LIPEAAPDEAKLDGDAKIREEAKVRPPPLDWRDRSMLASRRARAAGVSDAVLSIGVASADLERELRTDSSSFPLPAAPPLPADRYVLALSKSPFSALRAMASRRLRSITSNAGPVEDSPSKPDDDDEAGRAGSQSADDDDVTRPSIAHPPPKTKGVEATSPHVIIGSSEPNVDDDDDDAALPCPPGSIRGVIATNVPRPGDEGTRPGRSYRRRRWRRSRRRRDERRRPERKGRCCCCC
jgi:hypothetical protein